MSISRRKARELAGNDDKGVLLSPRVSDSPIHMVQMVDKRIERQTEVFKTLLLESEKRTEKQVDTFKSLLIEFENRLFNEFDKRILDMKRELHDVSKRIEKLETVSTEIDELKNEIKLLKVRTLKNANSIVACDLRINGIPFTNQENLSAIFDRICKTINITTPQTKAIYRLQNKNNKAKEISPDAVIIVKLHSPYDKNFFLKSLGIYKKINKTNLMLKYLGFQTDKSFNVNENLTNSNYKILRAAITLKKRQTLHSAYTFRGLVYVKRLKDDVPTCIDHIDGLDLFRGFTANSEQPHEDIV